MIYTLDWSSVNNPLIEYSTYIYRKQVYKNINKGIFLSLKESNIVLYLLLLFCHSIKREDGVTYTKLNIQKVMV